MAECARKGMIANGFSDKVSLYLYIYIYIFFFHFLHVFTLYTHISFPFITKVNYIIWETANQQLFFFFFFFFLFFLFFSLFFCYMFQFTIQIDVINYETLYAWGLLLCGSSCVLCVDCLQSVSPYTVCVFLLCFSYGQTAEHKHSCLTIREA